jgi:sulfate permease, SulP family
VGHYLVRTSTPRVRPVLPDAGFRHLTHQPGRTPCSQLAIVEILGDLYFGAVHHVEESVCRELARWPQQRFVLLRMRNVEQCDISGVHMLEALIRDCRQRGGDLFIVRAQEPALAMMRASGFCDYLGADHFLPEDSAIEHLYYRVLDPAVCVYECDERIFRECQNLPRGACATALMPHTEAPSGEVREMEPHELWAELHSERPPLVVDVREPREYHRGHVPQAQLIPLPRLLADTSAVPRERVVVCVCRSGRRSSRAAQALRQQGHDQAGMLRGGMLAWEQAGLLEAID